MVKNCKHLLRVSSSSLFLLFNCSHQICRTAGEMIWQPTRPSRINSSHCYYGMGERGRGSGRGKGGNSRDGVGEDGRGDGGGGGGRRGSRNVGGSGNDGGKSGKCQGN